MKSFSPILTVVGARPQFIKSVAVTRELARRGVDQWLVHAGQHPDDHMGSAFLAELGVGAPDARLHPAQASRSKRMADMLAGLSEEMARVAPAAVLVYGDTDATLAGALAAHHHSVPLVHVEAGLRSGDRAMPEEHNRIMTDSLSDLLCTTGPAPTAQLLKEGVGAGRILEVGDVMLDVALGVQDRLSGRLPEGWPTAKGPVMVVTLHRPATVDHPDRLRAALTALGRWSAASGGHVVFPVHPRTRSRMAEHGFVLPDGVVDCPPFGYLDMQAALFHADLVLTDSGGVQKEAWFQGTPGVVLRDTTEWRELVEVGASVLFDPARLLTSEGGAELDVLLAQDRQAVSVKASGLFGGGQAAARVVDGLKAFCG